MNSFVKLGAGFVGVVVVATILILWLTSGEDQEIRTIYSQLLIDARRYDPDAVLAHVATNYNHEGYDFAALTRLVKANVTRDRYDSVEERRDANIKVLGDNLAEIQAELVAMSSELGRRFPIAIKLRLRLEKDGGRWQITAINYERLK